MRKSGIVSLVVVALYACTLVAERPAQALEEDIAMTVVGEPNDPNAAACPCGPNPDSQWDPVTHIVATWESLTVKSKLNNPVGQADVKVPERSVSLSARVDVIDVNGLIGFDSTARGTLVLDEKPSVVCSKAAPSRYCRFLAASLSEDYARARPMGFAAPAVQLDGGHAHGPQPPLPGAAQQGRVVHVCPRQHGGQDG